MKKNSIAILILISILSSAIFNFYGTNYCHAYTSKNIAGSDIGIPWDKLTDKEKCSYTEKILLLILHPYIQESVNKYYGEIRQYDNAKITNIRPVTLKHQIKVQVTTFHGPHNPPYGLETITLELERSKITVTGFVHKKA
ncbi:MAG: DUF3888 domain-containing protein [Bacillota bacterium]|nr:DUF3888 domain-containing protein [Bacillota bacterium]